jgi:hypothetical protein
MAAHDLPDQDHDGPVVVAIDSRRAPDQALPPLSWMRAFRSLIPRPSAAAVVALWALALRMDADGTGFASVDQLVEDTGLSERTVRRALEWAQDQGALQRTRRGHRLGNGAAAASEYRLVTAPQPDTRDRLTPAQPDSADRLKTILNRSDDASQPVRRDTSTGHPCPPRRSSSGGPLPEEEPNPLRPTPAGLGRDPSKPPAKKVDEHPDTGRVTALFVELCQGNGHPTPDAPARAAKWRRSIDLLLRKGPTDGGGPPPVDEVEEVMRRWAADFNPGAKWPGWGKVVRSPDKFREKYPDLRGLGAPRRRQQDVSEFTESGRFQP